MFMNTMVNILDCLSWVLKNNEYEIHDLYIKPKARNGVVVRALIRQVLVSGEGIDFNIFKTNSRSKGFAEYFMKKEGITTVRTEKAVWGVDCWHYEIRR